MRVVFLLSLFISSTLFAAEDSCRRYPLTITNSSNKHVGANVNGLLFLLRCSDQNCSECRKNNFSNQVNMALLGPVTVKATYGSFKSLSKKGYKVIPELSKNAFMTMEYALLVGTAFSAAGYCFPAMQDLLSSVAKNYVPANGVSDARR